MSQTTNKISLALWTLCLSIAPLTLTMYEENTTQISTNPTTQKKKNELDNIFNTDTDDNIDPYTSDSDADYKDAYDNIDPYTSDNDPENSRGCWPESVIRIAEEEALRKNYEELEQDQINYYKKLEQDQINYYETIRAETIRAKEAIIEADKARKANRKKLLTDNHASSKIIAGHHLGESIVAYGSAYFLEHYVESQKQRGLAGTPWHEFLKKLLTTQNNNFRYALGSGVGNFIYTPKFIGNANVGLKVFNGIIKNKDALGRAATPLAHVGAVVTNATLNTAIALPAQNILPNNPYLNQAGQVVVQEVVRQSLHTNRPTASIALGINMAHQLPYATNEDTALGNLERKVRKNAVTSANTSAACGLADKAYKIIKNEEFSEADTFKNAAVVIVGGTVLGTAADYVVESEHAKKAGNYVRQSYQDTKKYVSIKIGDGSRAQRAKTCGYVVEDATKTVADWAKPWMDPIIKPLVIHYGISFLRSWVNRS